MLGLLEKVQVCNKPLKCVSKLPLAVGSSDNFLFCLDPKIDVSTGSAVNSCASFKEDGIVFGTADGRMGIFKNKIAKYCGLHSSNICSVDYIDGLLVTASWDNSINILEESPMGDISVGDACFTKKSLKLNETIWKVKVVNRNIFATAGTGKKITLYKNKKVFKEITNHAHVIRDFLISENDIFSVDNYGKVLKTTVSGEILKSRNLNEMCFSMCFYNNHVIVGGDNGTVFVLDKNLECISKLILPCTTVWDVKSHNDLVYCAGSDGFLYKLKEGSDSNYSSQPETNLENRDIDSQVPYEGSFVSEGVEYKSKDGTLYKRVGNEWETVGCAFQNKQPDNSFTVELSGKNYTLTFNDNENVHEVAERFLRHNKIDKSHHQEIVDFINKNFKKNNRYSYYSLIDIGGITKVIGSHPVVNILKKIIDGETLGLFDQSTKSVKEVEKYLSDPVIPTFVRLDICKYLVYKKIAIDLSFLFKIEIQNKKEAKAFVYLLTNMVEDPIFNLEPLYERTKKLIDLGLISLDECAKLNNNRNISNK